MIRSSAIRHNQPERAPRWSDTIQHSRLATGLNYEALVRGFERELGHLDPAHPRSLAARRVAWREVEKDIATAAGRHGLMIVSRLDLARLTSLSGAEKRCSLYLVGDPLLANRIINIDPRGSFYVPFRVGLYADGDPRGAVIAYDRPSSFLATLGHPELTEIAESLDRRIDAVAAAVRVL